MRVFRWVRCCGGKYQYAGTGKTAACPKCQKTVSIENEKYCVQYDHAGKQHIKCVGLKKDAETYAATIQVAKHTGDDLPQKEKPVTWSAATELFTDYNKEHVKDSTAEFYGYMLKPLTDTFGRHSLQEIDTDMLVAYCKERMMKVGKATINREITTLKRMYAVVKKTKRKGYPRLVSAAAEIADYEMYKEVAKTRALTMGEIKILWHNLPTLSPAVANVLKLILLTGQRPGEVAGITAAEIDGHWWTIPAERSKNGVANRVYMTQTALDLASSIHITRLAVSRALKGFNVNLGVASFTPHDLRRTMATRLAELGYADAVIDAIQNHKKQGIIKVYNQYQYAAEKQAALSAWCDKVLAFVGGETGKVVEFRQAA